MEGLSIVLMALITAGILGIVDPLAGQEPRKQAPRVAGLARPVGPPLMILPPWASIGVVMGGSLLLLARRKSCGA